MEPLIAVLTGLLFSSAIFCILQAHLIRMVVGLSILTSAVNLLIFAAGRMTRGVPPLIPLDAERLPSPSANPVPEALILTAIVISFGLLAFTIVLTYRAYSHFDTVEMKSLPSDDEPGAAA